MGLDCEETGVSTDGRFFRREPGMMKGTGEGEWGWKTGPLTAWAKTHKSRPVAHTWREDYGMVSPPTERSQRLATTS